MVNLEARKAAVIKMYDETNKGNIQPLRELLADDFVSYGGAGFQDIHGPEGFIDLWKTFTAAFPDLTFEVQFIIAEPEYMCVRGIQRGTHKGNFLGMVEATGNAVEWTGTAIFRFNDEGKITERWQDLDNLSLMQQLGVIPAFGGPGG
jgi:steroid delta-isomerase-like uncharacterized protein